MTTIIWSIRSKHQNPREGIETENKLQMFHVVQGVSGSKHQNPREGIETRAEQGVEFRSKTLRSKHQNPREGIETADQA